MSSTGFYVSGEFNTNEQFFDDDGKGNIRLYYFTGVTRNYTDITAGTVNYKTGKVSINALNILSISNIDGAASTRIRIVALPNSNDIVAVRNQILEIDVTNTKILGGIDTVAVGDESGAVTFDATPSTVDPTGTSY